MAAATSAVYIKEAYKHYGPKSGPKRKQVLEGLSMNVHRGSIYGLLGASGCGKTTLLSCIVGRRRLDSGEMWVLGGTPGTEGSGVPGPRIGYMPQETALIPEFTVKGVVTYFGRIFGMSESQIDDKFTELSNLLDLPPDDRLVRNCSGGQQRRISFAAALVHEPELLILDEPTVGLDPVLRERIWEYLVEITEKKNIAVIITTHYIEECRQAHKIGLMRQGYLLAEESPADLIRKYHAPTLEEVFLELSRRQVEGQLHKLPAAQDAPATGENHTGSRRESAISLEQENGSTDFLTANLKKGKRKKTSALTINGKRLKALFFKNWLQYIKNYAGVVFTIGFPIVQLAIFFIAIGQDPKDLPVAFVNDENSTCEYYDRQSFFWFNNKSECEFKYLSCRFMEEVDDPMIVKKYYPDIESALHAVTKGKIFGVVYFSKNYTYHTRERAIEARFASNQSLDEGEVRVWLDMSNRQIGPVLKQKLLKKYISYQKKILEDCKFYPKLGEVPVRFLDAVYGNENDSYTIFMAPGFIVTVAFFMATFMTSTVMITDRLEGVWDRTLVAGATAMEVLTTHVLTQFIIMVFQICEMMIVSFVVFGTNISGSVSDTFGIILLQGLAGMCYGFLISVACNSQTQANFTVTGSFYPMIIMSGVLWPVEGMPAVLRFVAYCLPFTIPINALRATTTKGMGITSTVVLDAYGVCFIWIALFLLFTLYVLKTKMV